MNKLFNEFGCGCVFFSCSLVIATFLNLFIMQIHSTNIHLHSWKIGFNYPKGMLLIIFVTGQKKSDRIAYMTWLDK